MWTCSTESTANSRPGYQFKSSFEVTMPHFLKYNVLRLAVYQEGMFLSKKYFHLFLIKVCRIKKGLYICLNKNKNKKEIMTTSQITEKIKMYLELPGSRYFNVQDSKGDTVKIRVSDHSGNYHNNKGEKTLSFISCTCNQGYRAMITEWEVDDLEDMFTTTYQSVVEILENELN